MDHWGLSQDFKNWMETQVTFCNTLVDRIVPGFPKENIHEIQTRLGYEDNLVVTAEPFLLWVIEAPEKVRKQFPTEETDLQVKFVSDLTAYRTRKVRILNGAHTAMVPVAYLMGLRRVKESVEHPVIGHYLRAIIFNEIIPTLDLGDDELKQFAHDVLERFQNPYIKHELISIALNSISKFKTRVLPSILEYSSRNKSLPPNLVFSLAALIRFYKGECNGVNIPLQDSPEVLAFFSSAWKAPSLAAISKLVLGNEEFWGLNLDKIDHLTESVTQYLELMEKGRWEIPRQNI
jgi:tagaturonate reductase